MMTPAEALDLLLDELADRVARRLSAVRAGGELVDQTTAPGLSKRAFLEAARGGAFPSSKVGRKIIAKRADVLGYIESKQRHTRAANPIDDLDEERIALGLRPKGRR